MKIREMPFYNTPGYKLNKKGPNSLDDAELLAILLDKGNKNENAIELANRLLKKYNLNRLGDCSIGELKKECDDYVKALKIKSFVELSKRHNKLCKGGYKKKITSAKDVYDLFVDELKDKKKEYFICLYLDSKNRIIREEIVSVGTLNSSLIHPREVFKTAIKESANSVILVHNHPSGDCSPSEEDLEVTEKLIKCGKILDIKVLDHVIVGKDWYSFNSNKN